MLSIDLFDSQFEKRLHEGAVDNTIEHLLKPLSLRAAEIRTKLRSGRLDPKQIDQLEKEYEELVQKRLDIILDRKPKTEQQPPPAKGLLKGKDLVTPQQRVAGATPPKTGIGAAVKDVAGGVKRWLKGEPDQGPTYEQQEPAQSPRAYGVANFQRLVKANMGNYPKLELEFANAANNIKLDKHGIDLISDYYDGLENDQIKNHFIYRVLPSADETRKILKSLGWQEQRQQELPGIPTQGELPLSEKAVQKKKSDEVDNIKARDVKVARELQKLRAMYPAAASDVEAVARAEIDSSERSQQQLTAIKGANEKQDALLKQLVSLDQEQGREINQLDQENDNLEQQLAQVQSTNDRLQQTIDQMTGTKKSTKPKAQATANVAPKSVNLIPDAPVDQTTKTAGEPATSPAMSAMAKQLKGFRQPAPPVNKPDTDVKSQDKETDVEKPSSLRALRPAQAANIDDFKLTGTEESVKEHLSKEPRTARERDEMIDKIRRMMSQDRNPANLQIMKKDIEILQTRYRDLKEESSINSEAAERAILNRIMVAHTDLLKQFGPEKVMQAAEEVAYNVGDVDEIGTSDVSAYVDQVKQILGVPRELDEKWSAKYKRSINCASPKGFSQRAHCQGRKK